MKSLHTLFSKIIIGLILVTFILSKQAAASETVTDATPTFAEAKRNAFNLAGALVNDGFRIRDGEWVIKLTPRKPVFLQLTFFSGNQYWFVAAAAPPARKLKVTLYDTTGKQIPLDTWKDDATVPGARAAGGFLASHSGKYFVGLELLESKENAKADTCLIYAYK